MIFLTFFFLLHYRANLSLGAELKIAAIVKTGFLLLSFNIICIQSMFMLIQHHALDYQNQSIMQAFSYSETLIFWCILTIICVGYLQKIKPQLITKEIFKSALLFTFCTDLFIIIMGNVLFIVEHFSPSAVNPNIPYRQYLLLQSGHLIVGSMVSALVATYAYYSKTSQAIAAPEK